MSTQRKAIAGLMTSITCILGPLSIAVPFSPVPISLGLFGILLTSVLLGAKTGTLCAGIYLLLGMAGLPVFSGFTGGIGTLLGPTGGYLLGYLAVAGCGDLFRTFSTHSPSSTPTYNKSAYFLSVAGFVCGLILCYLFGSLWLAHLLQISLGKALLIGALPYIPADIFKIILALWLGFILRKRLTKASLL